MKYVLVLIWIVFILLIIHNCHYIIRAVSENFQVSTSASNNTTSAPNDTTSVPSSTMFAPSSTMFASAPPSTTSAPKKIQIDYTRLNTSTNSINDEDKQIIATNINTILLSVNLPEETINNAIITFDDTYIFIEFDENIMTDIRTDIINKCELLFKKYVCHGVSSCPLASILSSHPEIGDKWGDSPGECVRNSNHKDSLCVRCPAGTYIDYGNVNDVCSKCPKGQYSDKYNSLDCKPCENDEAECVSELAETSLEGPLDEVVDQLYINNIDKLKQSQSLSFRLDRAEKKYDTYHGLKTNRDQMRQYLKKLHEQK